MLVFFRRIPNETRKSEITELITPMVKGSFFSKSGKILSISIIKRHSATSKQVTEHHAVVSIEPDDVALRIIKDMKSKTFKGKHILVREYFIRNEKNDPRKKKGFVSQDILDKRIGDRRSNSEAFVQPRIEADVTFARKY